MRVLAGDVGGTKALMGLIDFDGRRARVVRRERYVSADHADAAELLERAVEELGPSFDAVGLGLPGPIVGGEGYLPKLGWRVSERDVAHATGSGDVHLVNDFTAVGLAIDWLEPGQLARLQRNPEPRGPRALLGAGTGLGEGYALWQEGGWRAYPSEGGNTDFGPRTEELCSFTVYLRREIGRSPSYDDVLSGRGIVHLYRFLVGPGGMPETPEVRAEMEGEDPAAVVTRHAQEQSDAACERALKLFCSAYGAEAGNQALRFVATGGVYVAGGIAPRILAQLRSDVFLEAFRDKGPLSELAERVPLHVILDPDAGLLGAGAAAADARNAAGGSE